MYRHANENARIYLGIALLLTAAILFAIYSGAMRERKLIETTSQMRQAKDALAQANQELEMRVDERTADLEKEVHERKEAQIALAREPGTLRLGRGAVNDGIWDWNILTDEDYLSPRWKSILGLCRRRTSQRRIVLLRTHPPRRQGGRYRGGPRPSGRE